MRALTELERKLLTTTIAHQLTWTSASQYVRDDALYKAARLIERLETVGIHGATLKRAIEKLMAEDAA